MEEEGTNRQNAPGESIDCEATGYTDPAVSSIWRRVANFLEGEFVGERIVGYISRFLKNFSSHFINLNILLNTVIDTKG
jgi:hypothetical protein